MKGKKTGGKNFEKGRSGNIKGRPRSGCALSEILREEMEKTYNKVEARRNVIRKLYDIGMNGNVSALSKLLDLMMKADELDILAQLEERITILERINEGRKT